MTKPIQIKNEDVVRDIRELAGLRGKAITATVAELVRKELVREQRDALGVDRATAVSDTVARFQTAMKAHGGRPLADDDLYDQDGLPR